MKFEDELGNSTQPNDTDDDEARSLPSGWTERSHNGRAFLSTRSLARGRGCGPNGRHEARQPSGWTERSYNGRAFYVNTVLARTWVGRRHGDDEARACRVDGPSEATTAGPSMSTRSLARGRGPTTRVVPKRWWRLTHLLSVL